jgi:hypothetical protein
MSAFAVLVGVLVIIFTVTSTPQRTPSIPHKDIIVLCMPVPNETPAQFQACVSVAQQAWTLGWKAAQR